MSKVLIIIPAYNEEKYLGGVLDRTLRLRDTIPNLDLLVIDDGSKDYTAEIARSKHVEVIRHGNNAGEEAAIQTGFDYALKHNYDFVIKLDGDGQHNPSETLKILDPLLKNEADIVIGSRTSAYSEQLLFKFGRTFSANLISFLIQKPIKDPTSGFKGRNRAAVKFSRRIYLTTKWLHNDLVNDIEELFLYSKKKARIKEVPVDMNERKKVSKCYFSYRLLTFPFILLLTLLKSFVVARLIREGNLNKRS